MKGMMGRPGMTSTNMKRPNNVQPNRPRNDGYPYGLPQPAGAITYKINGALAGRGNILNFLGNVEGYSSDDQFNVTISGGGGGSPASPANGVQYNNAGAFGADSLFTRNPTTGVTRARRTFTSGLNTVNTGFTTGNVTPPGLGFSIPGSFLTQDISGPGIVFDGVADLSALGGTNLTGVTGYIDTSAGIQVISTLDATRIRTSYSNNVAGDSQLQMEANSFILSANAVGLSQYGFKSYSASGTPGWFVGSRNFILPATIPSVNDVLTVTGITGSDYTIGFAAGGGGGTPTLTQDRIAFGDSSNLMTSNALLGFNIASPLNGIFSVNLQGMGNGTAFKIDGDNQAVTTWTDGKFKINNAAGTGTLFEIDGAASSVRFGDNSTLVNGTRFELIPSSRLIASWVKNFQVGAENQTSNTFLLDTEHHEVAYGDIGGVNNETQMRLFDNSPQIYFQTQNLFEVRNVAMDRVLMTDCVSGTDFNFAAGDIDFANTGTQLRVNASARRTFVDNSTFGLFGYTVATLPAGTVGDTAYVTDALGASWGVAVAGGGVQVVPVFFNGSIWICA